MEREKKPPPLDPQIVPVIQSALAIVQQHAALVAERDALREAVAQRWRPIETAPKDGRSIIVHVPHLGMGSLVLCWEDGMWRDPVNAYGLKIMPTHWMPLPPLPEQTP